MAGRRVYQFGKFRLDPSAKVLLAEDRIIPLTPKVLDLLVVLVEGRGQVVAKEHLLKVVWPDTFVEESNLTANISILRKQLGVTPEGGEYIQTIPKRGYRFVAHIAEREEDPVGNSASVDENVIVAKRPPRVRLLALLCGLLLLIVFLTPVRKHFPGLNTAPRIAALAVLPLVNLSDDSSQEYFADGMTEALIGDLSQLGAIRVISRTSVMQYKNSKKSLPEIAKELRVDAVLRATVARSDHRVRITAQLIHVQTDRRLWAGSYERDIGDILALQGELARAISNEMRARISPSETAHLSRKRRVRSEAYEAFLKGRHYWNMYTAEGLLKSVEYFEQAVVLDPGYAEAFAGLADAWNFLQYTGAAPPDEARRKASSAAEKALQLDAGLAEAHSAMSVLKSLEWDWMAAEAEAHRAIELNPAYVPAHIAYSDQLRHRGLAQESIAEALRALDLDPVSPWANEQLADCYLSARKYDLAIEQYHKTLDLYPNRPSSRDSLGWAYIYTGKAEQGLQEIRQSYGEDPEISPEVAYVYATLGDKNRSQRILQRLLNLSKQAPVPPHHFALIYAGMGDKEQTLLWLEQAYQQHSQMMAWLKVDPRFDNLRPDPRFQELARRVGLL